MVSSENRMIIAVDGYSSSGKSTFAKAIAKKLGYVYIDSGAMYRAVTLYALQHGIIEDNNINLEKLSRHLDLIKIEFRFNRQTGQNETYLNGNNVEESIRGIRVSDHVSDISKIKFVREKMVEFQQEMGKDKGIVMDGRDISTVVFPGAELKIFMTAGVEIRAERRFKELIEKGLSVSFEEIRENIIKRDRIDENRKESPLRKAEDAIVLDNSHMTPDEQMVWFHDVLNKMGYDEG
jgi:cytidylate kinase